MFVVEFKTSGMTRINGYYAYSNICDVIPELHDDPKTYFSGWRHARATIGVLAFPERMYIRTDDVNKVLPLQGKIFKDVSDIEPLVIGPVASVTDIANLASKNLYCSCIVYRHKPGIEATISSTQLALDKLGVKAEIVMPTYRDGSYPLRKIDIKGGFIQGCPMGLILENEDDSYELLVHGLGAHRHFGIGVFNPVHHIRRIIDGYKSSRT